MNSNVLEIDMDAKPKPIMHEDCLDCGVKFTSQPYEVYGAVGGFFCRGCIEKNFPDVIRANAKREAERQQQEQKIQK
jgi:hypothetical protein